ncbi:hypothetical protein Ancab_013123 [Ancistrocladus abbreviatus]
MPRYTGIEDQHYAYSVRDRLRKQVLVPLNQSLEVPEVFMGANQWETVKYNRVASVVMNTQEALTSSTITRDSWLRWSVGKGKIAAGVLLPLETVDSLKDDNNRRVASSNGSNLLMICTKGEAAELHCSV